MPGAALRPLRRALTGKTAPGGPEYRATWPRPPQARAVQRSGELLAELPTGKPGPKAELKAEPGPELIGRNGEFQAGDGPELTRAETAKEAGLSARQTKTALRVAAVPNAEFEAAVESDNPPSVSKLAEKGTKKKKKAEKPEPAIDERVMFLWGRLRDIEKTILKKVATPHDLTVKVPNDYREDFTRIIPALTLWLKEFWP